MAGERAREVLARIDLEWDRLEAQRHHARVQQGRVVFPHELRGKFQEGRRPPVTTWGREPCPITPGMEYQLAPNLKLIFTEIRPNWKTHYRCIYTVQDFRPLTLRVRPSDSDGRRGDRLHWSPEEEHGYGHSVDTLDAGEVLDDIAQRKEDKKAELRRDQQAIVNEVRRERYDLSIRLARIRERARQERIDISSDERVIRKRIEALERRVLDKAA